MPRARVQPPKSAKWCPYEVLGIEASADPAEVRRAYRRRALASHPDKASGSATEFAQVQRAYELLADPERRSAFDERGLGAAEAVPFDVRGPRLSSADIDEFRREYVGSAEEAGEIRRHFVDLKGNVAKLHEYVPFLEGPEDVKRVEKVLKDSKAGINEELEGGTGDAVWSTYAKTLKGLKSTLRSRARFRKLVEEQDQRERTTQVVPKPDPGRPLTLLERLWLETGDPPDIPMPPARRSARGAGARK